MIQIKNLISSYEKEADTEEPKKVIDDVSLDINDGEFVAVLGHNGSGKSTLAKHFNAIMLPVSGKVYIDKMDTCDPDLVMQIRQCAGMVFQNPDNQMVATIVEDDVAFAPENLGLEREEIRRRVDEAMKAVGMYELRDKAPHMLSGGQKQRVAIAGVIAMQPKYIILDEPTAMLDPTGRKEVLDTIIRLNKEKGMTVILITHYMDEAVLADRVVVMDKGHIIIDDKPINVFVEVEKLKKIGLDVPQSTELMYHLIKEGIDVSQAVLDVDACADEILRLARQNGVN